MGATLNNKLRNATTNLDKGSKTLTNVTSVVLQK